MATFFNWRKDSFEFLNPYIIAEIGVNHGGDLDLAKKQILLAKEGGAHAVKFQAYKAHLIASQYHSPSYWDLSQEKTSSQFELFQKYDQFTPKEYQELAAFCKAYYIDFSCTPFDLESVKFLDPLVPFMKIASADITNVPLLRAVANTQKPIILSTGASTWKEIDFALDILKQAGAKHIALLHCVLNYPTPIENAQMILQDELSKVYGEDYLIGYSDHIPAMSNGEYPALDMSILRGANIIEKHFSHDITLPGNDHYHAFSPEGLKAWTQKLKIFQTLYGQSKTRNLELEQQAITNARRKIFLSRSMQKGDIIKPEDIIALRSNQGISIENFDQVLGKTLNKNKQKEDYLIWDDCF